MVEGMKFHVKGEELRNLFAKRATWHKDRAEILKTKNLKEAQEGMKAAVNAAASAGQSYGGDDVATMEVTEVMTLSYAGSPRRGHGGDVEDPVAAIKKAILFHTERASSLAFYSNHLVPETTYVLTESEIARYELIAASE